MTNESQDLVRQHVQKTDMRFPVAIVPAEQEYSVKGYPTAFLVDREGRIVWSGHPAALETEAGALFQQLLDAGP